MTFQSRVSGLVIGETAFMGSKMASLMFQSRVSGLVIGEGGISGGENRHNKVSVPSVGIGDWRALIFASREVIEG